MTTEDFDRELEALCARIAAKIFKQQYSLLEDRGLTPKDHEIFTKALKAYAKTEQELTNVRRMVRQGEEIPNEYKSEHPVIRAGTVKRGRKKTQAEREHLSVLIESLKNFEM